LKGKTLTLAQQDFVLGGPVADSTWHREGDIPHELCGQYSTRTVAGVRFTIEIGSEELLIDGSPVAVMDFDSGLVTWSGGPAKAPSGQITPLLDPLTLSPFLFGTVSQATGQTVRCYGSVVPPTNLWRSPPELDLPAPLWDKLVTLVAGQSQGDGLMLWHQAEKANLAALTLNVMLSRQLH
jgi:hypothetical protein